MYETKRFMFPRGLNGMMDYSHIKVGRHGVNGLNEDIRCDVVIDKADDRELAFHFEVNKEHSLAFIENSVVIQLLLLEKAGIFKKANFVL